MIGLKLADFLATINSGENWIILLENGTEVYRGEISGVAEVFRECYQVVSLFADGNDLLIKIKRNRELAKKYFIL